MIQLVVVGVDADDDVETDVAVVRELQTATEPVVSCRGLDSLSLLAGRKAPRSRVQPLNTHNDEIYAHRGPGSQKLEKRASRDVILRNTSTSSVRRSCADLPPI